MPGATAWLADVGAGDLHPLEIGGSGQHSPQQLTVVGLDPGPPRQADPRLGDPVGELVAQPLQLPEVENSRLPGGRRDPVIELDPAEGLGEEGRELALEPAHLAAQLVPSQALVNPDFEGIEAVSLEQIRHLPHTECNSSPSAGKGGRIKAR